MLLPLAFLTGSELLGLPEWICYAGLVVMTIGVFVLVAKAEKKA